MSDKDRGLEASKDEKVGFFERLRAGNIDDPSSEAYRRFGAGRGRAESSKAAPLVASEPAAPAMPQRSQDDAVALYDAGSGVVNDTKPDMPRQRLNASASKPVAPKPAPAKPPAMQEQSYRRMGGASADDRAQTYTRRGGATAEDRESFPRVAPASNPNYSNEGRGREMTKKQQVKGGRVKSAPKKMSSGGSVSPASKRADGIATRGKTRCKIC